MRFKDAMLVAFKIEKECEQRNAGSLEKLKNARKQIL